MHLPDINPAIFPPIGPFHIFGLTLGPLLIRWYALAYVAGIVLGWIYLGKLLRKEPIWAPRTPPITTDQLDDLILWITLGIILGGRIGYVLFYDASARAHPSEIFQIWNGGMSFHGGFTGVVIATLIYAYRQKFDAARMLSTGDLLACAAPVGLFFGRIANFINGELWGRPTTLPWGMIFCNKYLPTNSDGTCIAGEMPRHPSQLYEAALEGVLLFAVLWFLSQRLGKLKQPGLVMGTFIAGYGLIRILLENVRNPDAQMTGFQIITMGMILSVPMVLVGGFFIWNALRTPKVDA